MYTYIYICIHLNRLLCDDCVPSGWWLIPPSMPRWRLRCVKRSGRRKREANVLSLRWNIDIILGLTTERQGLHDLMVYVHENMMRCIYVYIYIYSHPGLDRIWNFQVIFTKVRWFLTITIFYLLQDDYTHIWANYTNSLSWIKTIKGDDSLWFFLLTIIPVSSRREVVIKFTQETWGMSSGTLRVC